MMMPPVYKDFKDALATKAVANELYPSNNTPRPFTDDMESVIGYEAGIRNKLMEMNARSLEEIRSIREENYHLKVENSELNFSKSKLTRELSSTKARVAELESRYKRNESELSYAKSRIIELKSDKHSLNVHLSSKESRIQALENKIGCYEQQTESYKARNAEVSNENKCLQSRISELMSKAEADKAGYESEFEAMKAKYAEELKGLETRFIESSQEVEQAQAKLSQNESELANLRDQVKDIPGLVQDKIVAENKAENLTDNCNAFESKLSKLCSDFAKMSEERDQFKSKSDRLELELSTRNHPDSSYVVRNILPESAETAHPIAHVVFRLLNANSANTRVPQLDDPSLP